MLSQYMVLSNGAHCMHAHVIVAAVFGGSDAMEHL